MQRHRTTEWYSKDIGIATLATGLLATLELYSIADVTATEIKGSTITRTLLQIRMNSNSISQNNELFWGLVQVNADAAAAAAFPDPEDLSDRPGWLARGKMENIQSDLSDSSQWTMLSIDLRGQRIMRTEETEYFLLIRNSGAFTLQWSAYVRTLIKRAP